MNRPPGIGDFIASFKGDTPGHPFRGNQYEGGSGAGEDWSEYDRQVEEDKKLYAAKVAAFHSEAEKQGFKKSVADDSVYKNNTYGDRDQYSSQVAVRYQKNSNDYRVSTSSKFPTPLGGNSVGNRNIFTSPNLNDALKVATNQFEKMRKYDQEREL